MSKQSYYLAGGLLICVILLIGCTANPGTQAATTNPQSESTPLKNTATAVPNTSEPTAIPSATPAPVSPTKESFSTNSTTSGSMPVMEAIGNVNCRKFPSAQSRILGYLKKGKQAEITGVDASGTWYQVQVPGKEDGSICWIFSENITITGDPGMIPVVSASRQD